MRRRVTGAGTGTTSRVAALAAVLALGLPTLAACGGGADGESASESASQQAKEHEHEQQLEGAADRSICQADATAVATPYGHGFPDAWRFPAQTTVYSVEDRGSTGVIVTGISSTPFKQILDFLNHDAVAAGFKITDGETEEHDAEANWSTGAQDGRWAIRESPQCPGETVIQVLAEPGS